MTHERDSNRGEPAAGEVTQLLQRANCGDQDAMDAAYALVYDELKRRARLVKRSSSGATSLVHEAYVRMVGAKPIAIQNRYHFYNYATKAMRRILVDKYRHETCETEGGRHRRTREVDLANVSAGQFDPADRLDLIDLDDALEKLNTEHERQYTVVMFRFFAGCEFQEIAQMLGKDVRTISRDWIAARAFLLSKLQACGNSGVGRS